MRLLLLSLLFSFCLFYVNASMVDLLCDAAGLASETYGIACKAGSGLIELYFNSLKGKTYQNFIKNNECARIKICPRNSYEICTDNNKDIYYESPNASQLSYEGWRGMNCYLFKLNERGCINNVCVCQDLDFCAGKKNKWTDTTSKKRDWNDWWSCQEAALHYDIDCSKPNMPFRTCMNLYKNAEKQCKK